MENDSGMKTKYLLAMKISTDMMEACAKHSPNSTDALVALELIFAFILKDRKENDAKETLETFSHNVRTWIKLEDNNADTK